MKVFDSNQVHMEASTLLSTGNEKSPELEERTESYINKRGSVVHCLLENSPEFR